MTGSLAQYFAQLEEAELLEGRLCQVGNQRDLRTLAACARRDHRLDDKGERVSLTPLIGEFN